MLAGYWHVFRSKCFIAWKCPNAEFLWSVFTRCRTEYGYFQSRFTVFSHSGWIFLRDYFNYSGSTLVRPFSSWLLPSECAMVMVKKMMLSEYFWTTNQLLSIFWTTNQLLSIWFTSKIRKGRSNWKCIWQS